jgi:hypothetical protein
MNDLAVSLHESDRFFGCLKLDSPFNQKESLVLDSVMVPRADLAFEHKDQFPAISLLDAVVYVKLGFPHSVEIVQTEVKRTGGNVRQL